MKKDVLLQEFQKAEKLRNYEREPFDNVRAVELVKTDQTEIPKPYFFDRKNRPQKSKGALFLNNVRCGSVGNFVLISAPAGAGKSALCEVLISLAINKENNINDTFGFSIEKFKKILYIDTERDRSDFADSCERALIRAGYNDVEEPSNVTFALFSELATIEERNKAILQVIEETECDLLVIDNAADLCGALNNEEIANKTVLWLTSLLKKKRIMAITTIHVNPNSEKARGHFGSELWRRSETAFLLTNDKATGKKCLTMEYGLGKNRSAIDNLNTYFAYDTNKNCFLSCEPAKKLKATEKRNIEALVEIFKNNLGGISYVMLCDLLEKNLNKKAPTIKEMLGKYIKENLLIKNDKLYLLNTEELLSTYSIVMEF